MRRITIDVDGVSPARYADIVNAIWMQMNAIGCDFTVTPTSGPYRPSSTSAGTNTARCRGRRAVDAAHRRRSRPVRTNPVPGMVPSRPGDVVE